MRSLIISHAMVTWQYDLERSRVLATRNPETGINPDTLAFMPVEDLRGVFAFLQRFAGEREAR